MTVSEIESNRSLSAGPYDLSDDEILQKLNKGVVDEIRKMPFDIDKIHRFQIHGAQRVYALSFDRGVYDLIWWDPEHQIYPVEKKHT